MIDKPLYLRVPYPILLLGFSVVVYFVLLQVQNVLPAKATFHRFWAIQLLALGTSFWIHQRLTNAALISGQVFVRAFMLTSAIKLFTFMVVMVIYALVDRPNAFGFIFNFLIIYLLYTVVEVWVSFKLFGPNKPS